MRRENAWMLPGFERAARDKAEALTSPRKRGRAVATTKSLRECARSGDRRRNDDGGKAGDVCGVAEVEAIGE